MSKPNEITGMIKKEEERSNKKSDPLANTVGNLMSIKGAIEKVLPSVGITPDRMIRIVITLLRQNKSLAEAAMQNPASLLGAVMMAAQLGLDPTNGLNQCALVPRKGKVCFDIMYEGYVELGYRSGIVESSVARTVYEKDTFSLKYGLNEELVHIPYLDGDPGKSKGYYLVVKLKGGGNIVVYMTKDQVRKIRDRHSVAYKAGLKDNTKQDSPWFTSEDRMGEKTVVKAGFRWIPKSPIIRAALALDETAREFKGIEGETDMSLVESENVWDVEEATENMEGREIIEVKTEEKPAGSLTGLK
jgi:recombination protein RecT